MKAVLPPPSGANQGQGPSSSRGRADEWSDNDRDGHHRTAVPRHQSIVSRRKLMEHCAGIENCFPQPKSPVHRGENACVHGHEELAIGMFDMLEQSDSAAALPSNSPASLRQRRLDGWTSTPKTGSGCCCGAPPSPTPEFARIANTAASPKVTSNISQLFTITRSHARSGAMRPPGTGNSCESVAPAGSYLDWGFLTQARSRFRRSQQAEFPVWRQLRRRRAPLVRVEIPSPATVCPW